MDPPHENDATHPEPPQASPSESPTRIPKKTQPLVEGVPGLAPPISLSQNGTMSNSFDDGGNNDSLTLPDGIRLPATVTPGMLDGRLRRAFFDLTPTQMREVLTEYDDAVRDKGGEIRNRTAYLFGVVKRYKTMSGDANPTPQGGLSDKVLMRLDELVASGFCTPDDLDLKIKDRMRMLCEQDALDAIDEINGCSRKDIRNFASYFMGIMNRYMRGERQNPLTRGSNRRDNRQHDFQGVNDDRFSHYGRNDSQSGREGRGDGRDRHSSRDGDRNRRRRRRSRSRSRSYDSRSRSRSRSRSPDHRRRRRSRSGSNDRHHSRRHDGPTRNSRSNNISLSLAKPYGQNQPLMTHTLPPPPPPPPPRPPQTMMQPMPQQPLPGQPQMMMPGGFQGQMQPPQQQQFMQPLGQISQTGQAMSVQMQQQLQQQQLQQQQLQQQQLIQQYLRQYQQVPGANMQLTQLGMMPGSQVALPSSMLLGQPTLGQSALGQPAPATQVNSQNFAMQSQNQGQPPLDIFHLADKAAQALSGRQFPQVNAPAPMSNPNFPPMPAPSASPGGPGQSFQTQNMTSEADLPRMVQYAVQNLRVTGHIETALDAPLCGMLKRLPENAALKALEVFSSCDLSKMRNKGAYLSGILKKELIKLGL